MGLISKIRVLGKAISSLALATSLFTMPHMEAETPFQQGESTLESLVADWYIDSSVAESGDGKVWETAFKTIQEGIDTANDADIVIVAPGIYVENIYFNGKNVILKSIKPYEENVIANTIIDAKRTMRTISFAGTENETCVLSGFTILNNKHQGIIYGRGTRATIQNNIIRGGSAHWWLDDHFSGLGGGLYDCDGIIQYNKILANWAEAAGGGLCDCDGIIQNNIISGNSAREGGGLIACSGVIRNNIIIANSADKGGGLAGCSGIIQNNTIHGNTANYGGGFYRGVAPIFNCIIWGNKATFGMQFWNYRPIKPVYSCIQDWTGGGEGNISADPRFVDPENNNFKLLSDSSCIDAGNPLAPYISAKDITGNPRILYGGKDFKPDMGAFEYRVNKIEKDTITGNPKLEWSSLADKTYSVYYSNDLKNWNFLDEIPSIGNATTTYELEMPVENRMFYRAEEK